MSDQKVVQTWECWGTVNKTNGLCDYWAFRNDDKDAAPCSKCQLDSCLNKPCTSCLVASTSDSPSWKAECVFCHKSICSRCVFLHCPEKPHCDLCAVGHMHTICSGCAIETGNWNRCAECDNLTEAVCYECHAPACYQMPIQCHAECDSVDKESATHWLCHRHWKEAPICPYCPGQTGFLCDNCRILCITCHRIAGCIRCIKIPSHRQCPSCQHSTIGLFQEEGELPRDLARLLHTYLYEDTKSVWLPSIRHPRMGIVSPETGRLQGKIGRGIDRKKAVKWSDSVITETTASTVSKYFIRSLAELFPDPVVGPFTIDWDSSVRGLVYLDSRLNGQILVLEAESNFLCHGPIHRPLIYEQDHLAGLAYWTFDRRDLFDE